MSRGDKYEAGTSESIPSDIGETPRPRRVAPRSPLVSSVGLIAICYGALTLAFGMLSGLGGACCVGTAPLLAPFAQHDPDAAKDLEQAHVSGWIELVKGLFFALVGLAFILCGIGVLFRSNLARYALLGVAAIAVVAECPFFVASAWLSLFEACDAIYLVVSVLISAGFAVFAFIVLLPSKAAEEFTR